MSYLPGDVKAPAKVRSLTDPQPERPAANSAATATPRHRGMGWNRWVVALRRVEILQAGPTPQYRTKVKNPGGNQVRNQARPGWRPLAFNLAYFGARREHPAVPRQRPFESSAPETVP